jgi:hypothetical protein
LEGNPRRDRTFSFTVEGSFAILMETAFALADPEQVARDAPRKRLLEK